MAEGPLFWVLFNAFVVGLLALDHFVFRSAGRAARFRVALGWSAFLVVLAAGFAVLLYFWRGPGKTVEFTTAYLIEESLSVDNLFVFLLLFLSFGVNPAQQRKVLTWGILGALVMRGIFILAGVGLIRRFHWIIYLFGAFLLFSGIRLFREGEEEIHPEKNPILRLFRRWMPVTKDYVNGKFFVRTPELCATPLLVALLVVETSDLLFAVDSIPAILAITLNTFIVYTSNVFAILGLRSMYFALATMMDIFHYLHYGLSVVLIFIGAKMLLSHYYEIPTVVALLTVLLVLGISVAASLLLPERTKVSAGP